MMMCKVIILLNVLFLIGDNFVAAFTNQWAVHIDGGPIVARLIAEEHGFRYLGQIFDDCYHFDHGSVMKRSVEPELEIHGRLVKDGRVKRAEQQRIRTRTKRDFVQQKTILNDDRWSLMWYLNRGNGLDMNVQDAWAEGITGRGIVVTILDDGLEKNHPDLKDNYDPQASYDVNSHDDDPMPRYDYTDSNRHGTRCAGEVAATANNSICAVGIAFHAQIGGVRMLDGDVTDAVEARSLSLNPQHIDIYSASWGPDDDGKTVDGPGELATRAFVEGITKGRDGKGSIFIWASGNGGKDGDNCNCDGYTNSIWTLSISSATENGYVPWYSEKCSSTLATTYSSGSTSERQIITTDLHHHCTNSHTGTSASAPLAAGICALVLEANRNLTWRDMQHIVVLTAKPANLNASDWVTNGVGRNVSHSFGYGLMDASAMVRMARKWKTVPEQHTCEVMSPQMGETIPAKRTQSFDLNVRECQGVNFLEHVQAKVTLSASRRGNLEIFLTSPQGTRSTLLAKRPRDLSKAGFNQWPFMSVHTWGENPLGTWTLEIHNDGRNEDILEEWKLIFYGTETAVKAEDKVIITEYEVPSETSTEVKHNIIGTVDNSWIGSQKIDSVLQTEHPRPTSEKQTSDNCKIMDGENDCLVCKENWFLTKGRCVLYCPAGTYGASDERYSVCAACHYSCARCSGPSGNQCTSCRADAILIEFHCVLSSISWKMQATRWFYWMTIFFVINLSTITAAGIYLCVFWFRRKHNPHTYDYSKVSYSQNAKAECGANDSASDSE